MIKKLVNARRDHMNKHAAKREESYDKLDGKLYDKYSGVIEPLLMEGEEVRKMYGLLRDFACLTSERLIFADVKGLSGNKKGFVCVFFKHIQEVVIEQGHITGAIQVSTMRRDYILEAPDKNMSSRFAKELMHAMRY